MKNKIFIIIILILSSCFSNASPEIHRQTIYCLARDLMIPKPGNSSGQAEGTGAFGQRSGCHPAGNRRVLEIMNTDATVIAVVLNINMPTKKGCTDIISMRLYDFHCITGQKSYPGLPPGDIPFLDCIPALGSKLATGLKTDASVYGPAGKQTEMSGLKKHKLWFYFGVPDILPPTPKEAFNKPSAKISEICRKFLFLPLITQIVADNKIRL